MTSELQRLWDNAWQAAQERQWIYGRLGRLSSDGSTVTVQVPHRKDFVYVRMGVTGEQGIDIARRRINVPLRPGLPVRMKRENGVLVVYEPDTVLMENDPNEPTNEYGVPYHVHTFLALSDAPASYSTHAGKYVKVNATEDALEFVVEPTYALNDLTDVDLTGLADNNVLQYDLATTTWKPAASVVPDPLPIGEVRAKDATGLKLRDDAGNYGILIADGGFVGVGGATSPFRRLHLFDGGVDLSGRLYLESTPGLSGPGVEMAFDAVGTRRSLIRTEAAGTLGTAITFWTQPDSAGAIAERVRITEAGHVGIATTDFKTWHSSYQALQLGLYDSLMFGVASGFTALQLLSNAYHDGTDWRRREAFGASKVAISHTGITISAVPTGLADSIISVWNDAVKISDTGFVTIGSSQTPVNPLYFYSTSTTHPFGMDRDANSRSSSFQWKTGGTNEWLFGERNLLNSDLYIYNYTVAAAVLRILQSNGHFGFGPDVNPQGLLHAHDGTGGNLFVTKTGINGTAQTIIPNGTGDVLRGCLLLGVLWATDGAHSAGLTRYVANNSSIVVNPDAPTNANAVTFAVSATGILTVQRTLGTKSYDFSGIIVWL